MNSRSPILLEGQGKDNDKKYLPPFHVETGTDPHDDQYGQEAQQGDGDRGNEMGNFVIDRVVIKIPLKRVSPDMEKEGKGDQERDFPRHDDMELPVNKGRNK
jgi:hypothetical protein